MERERDTAVEIECAKTTLTFFHLLDLRDGGGCAALIAVDGVWERQGKVLRGREAVSGALAERPTGRKTCHLVTNVVVTALGPREAKVDFCLLTFEGADSQDSAPPVGRPAGIRRCVDEMVLTDEGWRIARKSSAQVFRGN